MNDQLTQSAQRGARSAPPSGSALSRTMREVIEQMKMSDGEIYREPGGFWRIKNVAVTWWGTSTVEALVKRGALEYCDYQQRRGGGSFPIRARIAPNVRINRAA